MDDQTRCPLKKGLVGKDGTCCTQQLWLMHRVHCHAITSPPFQKGLHLLRQVMGIDQYCLAANRLQLPEPAPQQWLAADRDQAFRRVERDRPQTRTEACC